MRIIIETDAGTPGIHEIVTARSGAAIPMTASPGAGGAIDAGPAPDLGAPSQQGPAPETYAPGAPITQSFAAESAGPAPGAPEYYGEPL